MATVGGFNYIITVKYVKQFVYMFMILFFQCRHIITVCSQEELKPRGFREWEEETGEGTGLQSWDFLLRSWGCNIIQMWDKMYSRGTLRSSYTYIPILLTFS